MRYIDFYFDESGEKGFIGLDHDLSDIGIVAGVLVSSAKLSSFESNVEYIFSRIELEQGVKPHATDAFRDGRNSKVKEDLTNFLRESTEWQLVYEAIYPAGLMRYQMQNQAIIKSNSSIDSNVVVSKNEGRVRIYTELLEGILFKLDEHCQSEHADMVRMITDRIDSGLLREIRRRLELLKQSEHETKVTGYETRTGKVVQGSITTRAIGFDAHVKHISSITTEIHPSPMTQVADFLSNTLYRHLKQEGASSPGIRLHGSAALRAFPFRDQVLYIDDDHLGDSLYAID